MTKSKLDRAWERLFGLIVDRDLEVPDELVQRFEEAPPSDLLLRHNTFRTVVAAVARVADVAVGVGDEISAESGFSDRKLKDRINKTLVTAAEKIAEQLEAGVEPATGGELVAAAGVAPVPPDEEAVAIEGDARIEQEKERQKGSEEPEEEKQEQPPSLEGARSQGLSPERRNTLEKHCIVWYSRLERHDPDRVPDLRVPNVTLDTFRALPDDQLVAINRELDERCRSSKTAAHVYDREARALLDMVLAVKDRHLSTEEREFKGQLAKMGNVRSRINAIRRMSRPDFDALRNVCVAVLAGSAIDDLPSQGEDRHRPPEGQVQHREPKTGSSHTTPPNHEEEKAMTESEKKELQHLSEQVQKLAARTSDLPARADVSQVESKADAARRAIGAHDEAIESLGDRVAALEQSAGDPRVDPQKVADLEQQLQVLRQRTEGLDKGLQQRVAKADLTKRLNELESKLTALVDNKVTDELAGLPTKVTDLETQVAGLITADALNDAIDQRLQPIRDEIQALRQPAEEEPEDEDEEPRGRWFTKGRVAAAAALVVAAVLVIGGIVVWNEVATTVQVAPLATGQSD